MTCFLNMEESSWTWNSRNSYIESLLHSTTARNFIWKFPFPPEQRSLRTPLHPPPPLCQKKKKNHSTVRIISVYPSTMVQFQKKPLATESRFKKLGVRTARFKESPFLRFYLLPLRKTSTSPISTGWNIDRLHRLLGHLNIILHIPSPKSSLRTLQIEFVTFIWKHCTPFQLTTLISREPLKSEIILSCNLPTKRTENKS